MSTADILTEETTHCENRSNTSTHNTLFYSILVETVPRQAARLAQPDFVPAVPLVARRAHDATTPRKPVPANVRALRASALPNKCAPEPQTESIAEPIAE